MATSPTQPTLSTYRRLLSYVAPYKGRLALGVLFSLISGGSVFPLLLKFKDTFDTMLSPERATLGVTLGVAGAFIAITLVRGIGYYFGMYFINWAGNKAINDLRQRVFDRMQRLSMSYFGRAQTGDIISRITNDTASVQAVISQSVSDIVREPATIIGAAGFLLYNNWRLAVVSLIIFPICVLPVIAFGRKVRRYSRQGQELLGSLVSVVQENVGGIRVVKAFRGEDQECRKFRKENDHYFNRQMRMVAARNAPQPMMEMVSAIAVTAALLYMYVEKKPFSDFIAFGTGLTLMYTPAKRLGRLQSTIQSASASAERVFELLDQTVDVADRPGAVALSEPVREVEFRDVGFTYGDKPALRGVNLRVRAGECIALVGRTGSGKSTLISLLPRFFDVSSGAILLNGRDVRDYTLSSLRGAMGMVTQDTFLFNDSIANNISYGDPNPSRERVESAARRAQAHDFILQKPLGYDTVIGERGAQLSGGQRQRLAIARALYHDAPILILDEATSALDNESERLVQQAINEAMQGRTVFAIAHRLSTIQHANRILVLEEGAVAEEGTHAELLALNGRYKRYHDLQFQTVPGMAD